MGFRKLVAASPHYEGVTQRKIDFVKAGRKCKPWKTLGDLLNTTFHVEQISGRLLLAFHVEHQTFTFPSAITRC